MSLLSFTVQWIEEEEFVITSHYIQSCSGARTPAKPSQVLSIACSRLGTYRRHPSMWLQQDVQTLWNSTFYMIQSLMEQKWALGIFVSEYGLPDTLTAHQWILLEKVLSVLGPFEELTRKVSSSDAMAAEVIPAVTVLYRFLTRETDEDNGIKAMKGTLAAAVRKRFTDMEENPLYSIATLLDLK